MKSFRKSIFVVISVFIISVTAFAEGRFLVPGGHTIGMKAYAEGLVVTAVENGSPAGRAGLRQGDLLCGVENMPLQSVDQLAAELGKGQPISLQVRRGVQEKTLTVRPAFSDGAYRLGAYVRDHIAGIGTITYYDAATGEFGALGHGIADPSGSSLVPISGGDVIASRVRDVVKGVSGTAGQLRGEYDLTRVLGSFDRNTSRGVFGVMMTQSGAPLPVASAEEIRAGKAEIRSNVAGDRVDTYEIEIIRCYEKNTREGRDMLIRITDPELLSITGGIVQGMSGSPIIQDGKLVGAVTHVLVNDPTLGYGIFIENMLEAAG